MPRPSGFVDDRRWESNQLQFFCRKFLVLVHSRLSKLCQDLNLSEEIQQLVRTAVDLFDSTILSTLDRAGITSSRCSRRS